MQMPEVSAILPKKEEELDAYRAHDAAMKAAWNTENPERVLEIAKDVRNKAKDAGRFHCDTCNVNLATRSAFEKHYVSKIHLDATNGKMPSGKITKSAIAYEAVRDQAKGDQLHHCSACNKSFDTDWALSLTEEELKPAAAICKKNSNIRN